MTITTPEKNLEIVTAKQLLEISASADPQGRPTGDSVRQLAFAYIGNAPSKTSRRVYPLGERSRWGSGVYMHKVVKTEAVVPGEEEDITLSYEKHTYHGTRRFAPDSRRLIPVYRELGALPFSEGEHFNQNESVHLSGGIGGTVSYAVFKDGNQRVDGVTPQQMLDLPDLPARQP